MSSEDYGYLIGRIPGLMFWLDVGRGIRLRKERSGPALSGVVHEMGVMD